jgi:Holliday junction DNA helicase RuvB
MAFTDDVLALYRPARSAAASGDAQGAAQGILALAELCERQYNLGVENAANRAKLRGYYQKFYGYADYIVKQGLTRPILVFFGLIDDASLPSFGDIMRGGDGGVPPKVGYIDPVDAYSGGKKAVGGTAKPQPITPLAPVGGTAKPQPINPLAPIAPDNKAGGGTDAPVFDPESLEDFIGQQKIIKRIYAEIKAAKKRGEKFLDHILLFGSRGLGKTTLMKLIAKELGVRFELLDCTQFQTDAESKRAIQRFLQNIARENEPVVIGFDEIGFCPNKLQSALLTLLNDRKFAWLDKNGKSHYVQIDSFTFIGATTDPQDLLPTLKDRCKNLTFYLQDYTRDELRRIFLNKFASKKLRIDDNALVECINRCRSSIREVNSFVKGLYTLALNADTDLVTAAMTAEYFANAGLDPIGLTSYDIAVLNALSNDSSGVMAEDTIAAVIGLDTKTYHSEYEPYLLRIGFIVISGRGRSLSDKARVYLKDGFYDFGGESAKTLTEKVPKTDNVGEAEKTVTEEAPKIDSGDESENKTCEKAPKNDSGNEPIDGLKPEGDKR